LSNYAGALQEQGRFEEAVGVYEKTIEYLEVCYNFTHPFLSSISMTARSRLEQKKEKIADKKGKE